MEWTAFIVVIVLFLVTSLKVIKEYERGVVFLLVRLLECAGLGSLFSFLFLRK